MEDLFLSLRNKYKEFIYHSYEIKENNDSIEIKYEFEIPNLSKFEPKMNQ